MLYEILQDFLPFIAAIPGYKVVIEVEIGPRHRHHQHEFAKRIEMFRAQKILHILHRRTNQEEHDRHRRHTRVQGTDHEVGAEDRGRPAGTGRHGKVPGHDRMHREHDRDDGKGKDVHGGL